MSDGTNTASYSYLANSPLVGQITFQRSGTTRMTTTKQYDYVNRLTSISSTGGSVSAGPVSFTYAYNPANQRVRSTLVDGSYWVYGYDSLGQVISGIKYWSDGTPVAGQQFDYTFDTIGNRTQTEAGGDQTGANLRLAHYTNNVLNQITSRDVPGDVDVMGLLLASNTVTVNSNTPYRRGEYFRDQLAVTNTSAAVWTNITVASPGQASVSGHAYVARTPETNTYDLDGNLLSDGRWIYSWDAENRLTNMTSLSGAPSGSQLNLSFVYDYMGRRIQKVVSTNSGSGYVVEYTDNYAYDGWNCVAVLNSSLSLVSSFLWGTDLSGSMQGAGGVGGLVQVNYYGSSPTNCFVAYDGNGNVVALVNAADGSTLSLYEYGPFGELIRATGPMAKLNPFRFSTKYDDDESDLLYYGYRYYNASTGRWLSRDPLGSMRRNRSVQASWQRVAANEYLFVQNDSCDLIDALGLDVYKVRISTSRCFDHRAVIGDVGDGKHSYYLDVYGIDGKNSCGCPVCSGASGFRYTLLSWPASQAVHQSIFNNNMRPVGHVVTHSDVDAQLNEIAQNKPGQLWNYKFILHDCGNFANEWLHFARELEWEEHGDTPYPPF